MPWINGWVHSRKRSNASGHTANLIQLLFILLVQWIISNSLFYLLRYSFLDYQLLPSREEIDQYLVASLVSRAIDLALFAGLLSWVYQNSQLHRRKMEVSEKETELQRSKLQSLKNQLNPHFLFNTMHNIAALIGHDDDSAHKLTVKVSHLMRKIMSINELTEHRLEDEWKFVQDYLEVEMERFQDRLILDVSFDDRLKDKVIPTLILQPLVENAFKHGIAHAVNPVQLKISVTSEENYDCIQVSNELFSSTEGVLVSGVGLGNLKDRLDAYYHGKADLITEVQNQRFIATLRLPHK